MKKRMKLKYSSKFFVSKKNMVIMTFILVLCCDVFLFNLLGKHISPILLDYAEMETTKLSTLIINKAVENQISNNFKPDDMIKTITNKNGEIVSVDFDTNVVNQSLVSINNTISVNLKYLEEGKLDLLDIANVNNVYTYKSDNNIIYQIPLGVITESPIIADIGPKIPVKTNTIGSVISNVRTDLTPYGINNALVKVYIEVTVTEQVILPFVSRKIDISLEVPVLVKIINGSIPNVYGGGYSVSSPLNSNTNTE